MNSRVAPGEVADRSQPVQPRFAIVTASYAPDFERCRLLCETMDRHVVGFDHHYILVERRDAALFRQLAGAQRSVVDERALLPGWLRPFDDPTSLFRRRIWLSLRTRPLRGWHVQQLRRIAVAAHVPEDVLVYCDSDVAFLKPFDCRVFQRGDRTRLFRRDDGLAGRRLADHHTWSVNAARLLGIEDPSQLRHDYITTLIAWRRDTLLAMCRRIEKVSGRHWVEAIGADRKFSECIIYGRYVDEVLAGAGHFHGSQEYCRVQWWDALSDRELEAFVASMTPEQVAIGMQSFIGGDIGRVRRLIERIGGA
jgi:hypothetical protein